MTPSANNPFHSTHSPTTDDLSAAAAAAAAAADRLAIQKEAQRIRSIEIQRDIQDHSKPLASVADTLRQVVQLNGGTLPDDDTHDAAIASSPAAIAAAHDFHDPCGPFEGPEKLLELWFAEEPADVEGCTWSRADDTARAGYHGLRTVPKHVWETMLDIVKCKVLSVIEGADVDAYLLSESSMFVFPHKLILKTCGTTTLLLGLERLLEIANEALADLGRTTAAKLTRLDPSAVADADDDAHHVEANGDDSKERRLGSSVVHAFYSRKSFMFPERQKGPHRDWMLEVAVLDRFFDFGAAYTVGKMNGDHWLLWMGCEGAREAESSLAVVTPAVERPLRLPTPCVEDQTLEILMTHLSPASCQRFVFDESLPHPTMGECYPLRFPHGAQDEGFDAPASHLDKGHAQGLALSNRLRLTHLFPQTRLDAFAFEPCGYSANAVMPRRGRADQAGYWTIHVTPEEESSYASFETNVALLPSSSSSVGGGEGEEADSPATLPSLVSRIVTTFEPGKLSVTLFVATAGDGATKKEKEEVELNGDALHSLTLQGYKRTDRIAYEFERYDLVFVSFERRR